MLNESHLADNWMLRATKRPWFNEIFHSIQEMSRWVEDDKGGFPGLLLGPSFLQETFSLEKPQMYESGLKLTYRCLQKPLQCGTVWTCWYIITGSKKQKQQWTTTACGESFIYLPLTSLSDWRLFPTLFFPRHKHMYTESGISYFCPKLTHPSSPWDAIALL